MRVLWLIGLLALTCRTSAEAPPVRFLFDGKFPSNFRGYKMQDFPIGSWSAWGGMISSLPGVDKSDLVIRENCTNFEFTVDFRLFRGLQGGVIYLAKENAARAADDGLKMAISNDGREGNADSTKQTGSLYGLLAAQPVRLKHGGHWNEARIVVQTNHVEHWINGSLVLEFDLEKDLPAHFARRKQFATGFQHGKSEGGYIVLEHNGGGIQFRSPRLRVIPGGPKTDNKASNVPDLLPD